MAVNTQLIHILILVVAIENTQQRDADYQCCYFNHNCVGTNTNFKNKMKTLSMKCVGALGLYVNSHALLFLLAHYPTYNPYIFQN